MEEIVIYELIQSEMISEDDIAYISYGIAVYVFCDKKYKKIDEIKDISTKKQFVECLVQKFNALKLSSVHFRECVLDNI